MGFLKRLFGKEEAKKREPVVVVSGLPRSGTSMMMRMLDQGGIPPITDEIREADVDNPKGYYEFERVKQLDKGDHGWLPDAEGKAVKVISALLKHLPAGHEYKVIFMRRDVQEVLASQKKMLINRGEDTDRVSDEELEELYKKHLGQVMGWLTSQPNVALLNVSYNNLLANPRAELVAVNQFLGGGLEIESMASVADPTLYRNRKETA